MRFIATSINQSKYKVYADIEGFRTNAVGTIPPEVLISRDKPDLVIIDEDNKKVQTFELTVPHISNLKKQHESKSNKYKYLESETKEYGVQTQAFEFEVRGHISKESKRIIYKIYKLCSPKGSFKDFEANISKLPINGSYYIYMCRNQTEWADIPLLKA